MYYHVFIQGSICSRVLKGEIYSRAISVQGQYLFKERIYSIICSSNTYLLKGSIYSRVVSVQGQYLLSVPGGIYHG